MLETRRRGPRPPPMPTLMRKEAEQDKLREERWISLYTQLTGASEAEARACWMFAPEPPPAPEIILDGDKSYDARP